MQPDFDIIIIGAGPAGMAAAIEAKAHGASVCILDEQPTPGGQIYRNVMKASPQQDKILGADYRAGRSLAKDFMASGAIIHARVTVWSVTVAGTVTFSENGHTRQLHARHIILATGAMERPVPLPGWTLPGTMTAGAAQILMKSGAMVAQGAVLVGCGPLLYLVAAQMLQAGARPKALVETQTRHDMVAALRHINGAVRGWRQLLKGLTLIARLKLAGVRRFKAASAIEIIGSHTTQAVRFRAGGETHQIETETVLLHQGVVPNTQITRSLRLEHSYDQAQHCFHPVTDRYGQSSHPMVSIAGDGAGIGGAKVAGLSGRITALNALLRIDILTEDQRNIHAAPFLISRQRELAIRPFLDTLYPPSETVLKPDNDTIICRCEEVTAGDIRRYASLGCTGPNQTKSFGRSGMGPCQGRFCGLTVTELLAAETGQTQDQVGAYRIRSPLKPVTLQELAELANIKDEKSE
ncbi:FAD-dependent oxidoreductase [Agrobacterium vitis]|uniref:FAD/NAD(P)-dependent oxidoreductase n=1 Tax=Agrobacterium vitis TaxID=373 RepID=UPI0012E8A38B|nr:NAD(P)/FAD-dependent oxidoreductase [Agrobacterium vitis]MVA73130.1 FAD-dependent oxidoreductase [Agrobacterium vitis]